MPPLLLLALLTLALAAASAASLAPLPDRSTSCPSPGGARRIEGVSLLARVQSMGRASVNLISSEEMEEEDTGLEEEAEGQHKQQEEHQVDKQDVKQQEQRRQQQEQEKETHSLPVSGPLPLERSEGQAVATPGLDDSASQAPGAVSHRLGLFSNGEQSSVTPFFGLRTHRQVPLLPGDAAGRLATLRPSSFGSRSFSMSPTLLLELHLGAVSMQQLQSVAQGSVVDFLLELSTKLAKAKGFEHLHVKIAGIHGRYSRRAHQEAASLLAGEPRPESEVVVPFTVSPVDTTPGSQAWLVQALNAHLNISTDLFRTSRFAFALRNATVVEATHAHMQKTEPHEQNSHWNSFSDVTMLIPVGIAVAIAVVFFCVVVI